MVSTREGDLVTVHNNAVSIEPSIRGSFVKGESCEA
jgi:hypothetical protein